MLGLVTDQGIIAYTTAGLLWNNYPTPTLSVALELIRELSFNNPATPAKAVGYHIPSEVTSLGLLMKN